MKGFKPNHKMSHGGDMGGDGRTVQQYCGHAMNAGRDAESAICDAMRKRILRK